MKIAINTTFHLHWDDLDVEMKVTRGDEQAILDFTDRVLKMIDDKPPSQVRRSAVVRKSLLVNDPRFKLTDEQKAEFMKAWEEQGSPYPEE